MAKHDNENEQQEEPTSYPNRGNKPLQERVLALGEDVKTLKDTVGQLIETIRAGQMAGAGDNTSLVWKLYMEEKKQRMELFDRMLKTLEERATSNEGQQTGSIESLLAIAQDETTGPMVQRLLGKEPDWERLIDKVFDRLSPGPGPGPGARPSVARAVPATPAVEVVK